MRTAISRGSDSVEEARELLAAARANGFDGVQLKPHQYRDFAPDAGAFREAFGELSGLARAGLVAYPGHEPGGWRAALEPLISFGAELGAELICISAGVRPREMPAGGYPEVADRLAQIGRLAREHGLRISLHNHAGTAFATADDLRRLFDHLSPDVCGLTLDTAHAGKAGEPDIAALAAEFWTFLDNVHLKDLSAHGEFCPLGTGTLDLVPLLELLRAEGYSGWLVADEESPGIGPDEACRLSMEYLVEHNVAQPGL
ncbi:MAG: sugar phosphate isomerase/epimerase family protein [Candidatus Brocadiia bacterium]